MLWRREGRRNAARGGGKGEGDGGGGGKKQVKKPADEWDSQEESEEEFDNGENNALAANNEGPPMSQYDSFVTSLNSIFDREKGEVDVSVVVEELGMDSDPA